VLDVVPVEEDKTLPAIPSTRFRSAARSSGALLPFFVGCLLVFGLGLLGLAGVGAWWYLKDEPTSPTSESAARPHEEVPKVDEKVPKVEGKGWTILLRSDDPSVWNTGGDGRNYALPLNRAPATIRYLRLRRMDTREMLILPLTRAELGVATLPAKPGGCSWNGTAKLDWGGRHLGIAQGVRHNFPIPNGTITLLNEGWDGWAGSGFGHKAFVNDTQYYAWKGQEIGRTVFEIAVTGQELDAEEKRCLLSR
jgi:hypothetical protein